MALAQFNGDLYCAWEDATSNGTLSIAFSTDEGQTWSVEFQPFGKGNTFSAPALAVFGGKLWLAWTGTDANSTLNLASSTNGTVFTQATQPLGRNNSPRRAVPRSVRRPAVLRLERHRLQGHA